MKMIGKFLFNGLLWLCDHILVILFIPPMFIMVWIVSRTESTMIARILKQSLLLYLFIGFIFTIFEEAVSKNMDINEKWKDYTHQISVLSKLSPKEIVENLDDFSPLNI